MSSVNPSWPPPDPRYFFKRHQPSRAAYVFAIVLPLVLIAILAAPLGIVLLMRSTSLTEPGTGSSGSPTDGSPGVGDQYFPDAGSGGYDVLKYEISINWDAATASMKGTTKITARATQFLESFYVDLALQTDRVQVDGEEATFEKQDFQDVQVIPDDPIAAESDFELVVDYSGAPGTLARGEVKPWFTTGQEWTVVGEPESAAWWFPSNDHPSDPALMDVSIRVPAGLEAISVGRLESADAANEKDFNTWHWVARQPMATYVNFISIGQYELKQGLDHGRPYAYAVSEQLSPDDRKTAFAALMSTEMRIRTLETMFGPYPFSEIGGIVPVHKLWFGGLETQTRPVYDARSILNADFEPSLIDHELAHMWFGDNVTMRQWNDIFISEAYASWAQWGARERRGGRPANDSLNRAYERLADNDDFWKITMIDPGRAHLFDAVYLRGPMTLQALRNVIGDDSFFGLARDWSQAPGSRTLEEWMTAAQAHTTVDLGPFFQAWIYSPTAPARTAANGFR
jgi:aminopeptidase N